MHRSLLVNYVEILTDLLKRKFETSWFEFKENWFEAEKLGKYISVLSNVALINHSDYAYIFWGPQVHHNWSF